MVDYTELTDRTLWFDGDSSIKSENLLSHIAAGNVTNLFVDQITPTIQKYNSLVDDHEKIAVKKSALPNKFNWHLPIKYQTINIQGYVIDKLYELNLSDQQLEVRAKRIAMEMSKFKRYQMEQILRTMIYVIETFKEKNIIWGVGRGSSVSSYVLFLIGVHDVDSVEYQLDFDEFLHI